MIRRLFLSFFAAPFLQTGHPQIPDALDDAFYIATLGPTRVMIELGRAREQVHRPNHERMAEALRETARHIERPGLNITITVDDPSGAFKSAIDIPTKKMHR